MTTVSVGVAEMKALLGAWKPGGVLEVIDAHTLRVQDELPVGQVPMAMAVVES